MFTSVQFNQSTNPTVLPSCKVPVRTKIQIVSILDKYFLSLLDGVDGGQTGDDPPPRMVKHHELRVGDEAVVGLVGQGGAVVGQIAELHRDIDGSSGLL